MKIVLALLAIGTIIVGLFGIGATPWLGWLDVVLGVVALLSVGVGGTARGSSVATPGAVGVGLLALWIIGLAVGAYTGLVWWTFAFGVAFLLLAGGGLGAGPRVGPRSTGGGPSI